MKMSFPCGSDGKQSASNEGDVGSTPGSGRSSEEGNGNPLQHSCLGNPCTEELAGYSPQGRKELDTTEQLTLRLFHFRLKDVLYNTGKYSHYFAIMVNGK